MVTADSALVFFSPSLESGVIYLSQHLGLLISHSPGSFFQDSAVGVFGRTRDPS